MLSHPVPRAYSGTVYDADHRKIFYFGGGQGGPVGNDTELYDIATNAWAQQYQPECLPTCCQANGFACDPPTCGQTMNCACHIVYGVGAAELTPLGRPFVEHAYRLIAYNPVRRRYLAALTGNTWEWDPDPTHWTASSGWTRLVNGRPFSNDIATKHVTYDPDVGMLYFATAPDNPPPTVYRFDYQTNTWVVHGAMPEVIYEQWEQFYTAYDTAGRRHLAIHHGSGGTFWLYDAKTGTEPTAGTWTQITTVPTQILKTATRPPPSSFDYDPSNAVFLVASRQDDNTLSLWSYDPVAERWTSIYALGALPRSVSAGEFGTMHYDLGSRQFYYLNTIQLQDTEDALDEWTFKLNLAALPFTPTATPTGPTATPIRPTATATATLIPTRPTPTPVPPTLTPTPTLSAVTCANPNDVLATFYITSAADDAFVSRQLGVYPLPAGLGDGVVLTDSKVAVVRSRLSASGYYLYNGLLRWDTSALAGTGAVTQAWLRVNAETIDYSDDLQLTAGWYTWTGVQADWIPAPETDALDGVPLRGLKVNQLNIIPLTRVSGIATGGTTGMRLHISQLANDAAPTGRNQVTWTSFEGGGTADLIVCSRSSKPLACVGDCNDDGQVTIDELLKMVRIALSDAAMSVCMAGDANGDDQITVDEIVAAVRTALDRCPEGSVKNYG